MSTPTKQEIIASAQEIAERMGVDTLRREDFFKNSTFTESQIYRLFPDDGWRGLLEAANLKVTFQTEATSHESLLEEFHRVVREMGCIPTGRQLDARSKFALATYKKHFGGIRGTLKKYHDWLEQLDRNAPELKLLQIKSKHEIIAQPIPTLINNGSQLSNGSQQWTKSSGVVFGAPISFRGLRHAPTNEQGVVYLFGMVSYELGLIVEAVQSAYPDCEAKRCVDSKRNRWQRVRIEFEFCSSNFKVHGHDPDGCDMVVCWEHDWRDCPLEVIELRSVIDQLEG